MQSVHLRLSHCCVNFFLSDFLIRCKKNITLDKTKKRKHKEGASDRDEWEQFIDQKLLEVWRRPVDSSGLYEYKGIVYGTINKNLMVFKIINYRFGKHTSKQWQLCGKEKEIWRIRNYMLELNIFITTLPLKLI